MKINLFDEFLFLTFKVEASVVEWLARESTIPNNQVRFRAGTNPSEIQQIKRGWENCKSTQKFTLKYNFNVFY